MSPPLVTPNTLAQFLNFNPDHQSQLHESPRPKYKELIQNIKQWVKMPTAMCRFFYPFNWLFVTNSLAVALDDRGIESDLLQAIKVRLGDHNQLATAWIITITMQDDKKINDYLGQSPSDEGDDDILHRITSMIAQLAASLATQSHSKSPSSSSSSEP